MSAVRRALVALSELDIDLGTAEAGPTVRVSRSGEMLVTGRPFAGS